MKKNKGQDGKKSKKTAVLIGAGVLVVVVIIGIILACVNGDPEVKQEYTTLEQVDVNGMTVSEACEALRGKGWQVLEVAGKNNFTTKSDCSDKEHKVSSVLYYKEKYYISTGDPNSQYEKVRIYFNDDAGENAAGSAEVGLGSSTSTSNSTSNSTSGATSSDNSVNASFRKVMDDYESFMNKYVEFMKRYKNSSDTMSMLAEYSTMMQDYAKFADSISSYNQNNLSTADWAYYIEVTTRVNKKLLEVK